MCNIYQFILRLKLKLGLLKGTLARNFTTYFLVRSQILDYLKIVCNISRQKNVNAYN